MASLSTCHLELVVWDGNLVKTSNNVCRIILHCCSGPVSSIKSAEMGLGQSRMDTYVLSWTLGRQEDYLNTTVGTQKEHRQQSLIEAFSRAHFHMLNLTLINKHNILYMWSLLRGRKAVWSCLCGRMVVWSCMCGRKAVWTCLCGRKAVWSCMCGRKAVWSCMCGRKAVWSCTCGRKAVWSCMCGRKAVWSCMCGRKYNSIKKISRAPMYYPGFQNLMSEMM